jgi:hypothetical protein
VNTAQIIEETSVKEIEITWCDNHKEMWQNCDVYIYAGWVHINYFGSDKSVWIPSGNIRNVNIKRHSH